MLQVWNKGGVCSGRRTGRGANHRAMWEPAGFGLKVSERLGEPLFVCLESHAHAGRSPSPRTWM